MDHKQHYDYILGLDLGVSSIGWAILPAVVPEDGSPIRVDSDAINIDTVHSGVRIFESGMAGGDSAYQKGKEESRNLERRSARGIRRQTWRRKRRLTKLFNLLLRKGLLPNYDDNRQKLFNKLDKELWDKFAQTATQEERRRLAHVYLYVLRAKALSERVDIFELGRIFYAIAQHRGFLSNKKDQSAESQDSTFKEELKKLQEAIQENARSLGEYLSQIDPEYIETKADKSQDTTRLRTRRLLRAELLEEFELVWRKQAEFYPELLTKEFYQELHNAIFFQRPLKSQKDLIGKCEFELGERCVEKGDPVFQEFRYWQRLLDLRIIERDGEGREVKRELTREEQDKVADFLTGSSTVTYAALKKLLKLKKDCKFNFEFDEDKDKKTMPGNKTYGKILKCLADNEYPVSPQEDVLEKLARFILEYEKEDALANKIEKTFPDFPQTVCQELAKLTFEPDYASLSKKAAQKILAEMKEKRVPYKTACDNIYRELMEARSREKKFDLLPPLQYSPYRGMFVRDDVIGDVRNPTVTRTLTEMRKVVNAIVREWGKPAMIRVELARDLKKNRAAREDAMKTNRQNENARTKAQEELERLQKEFGVSFAITRRDIDKFLLWKECNQICPYTGKQIDFPSLFGPTPSFDIEHIIPYSRSLDDSMMNKTLCESRENREVKKNKTPFECYSSNDAKWVEILDRVGKFKGDRGRVYAKLRRFQQQVVDPNDLPDRYLNDTRYASRLALRYLGVLYGVDQNGYEYLEAPEGEERPRGRKRVQAATGGISAMLRRAWDLNHILGEDGEKNRGDNRHHAVDAFVIAATDARLLQLINKNAAIVDDSSHKILYKLLEDKIAELRPCNEFWAVVKNSIDKLIVSHRVDRKVSGPIHEATIFSPTPNPNNANERCVRRSLSNISAKDCENIVDPQIKRVVLEKLKENGNDPKKFATNPPIVYTRGGRTIIVKKVRCWDNAVKVTLGKDQRVVKTGSNHHMEVFGPIDKNSKLKWKANIVTMLEAYRRKSAGEPIVQTHADAGYEFKYSLALNEAIMTHFGDDEKPSQLFIVRTVSQEQGGRIGAWLHNDSKGDIVKYRPLINVLNRDHVVKVRIDLLGNISIVKD